MINNIKRIIIRKLALAFIILAFCPALIAQEYQPSPENLRKREWFNNSRFGIMVHWGLYTMLAGGGEQEPSEWILRTKQIGPDNYKRLAQFFNPSEFSADEWVRIIKGSGAGYMNFVVKHGDGFLLYDSETTDFNITKTPFGRDVLREIKDACNKNGLGLILHYYQMDLTSPDYLSAKMNIEKDDDHWQRFLETQNKQVHELVTRYGNLDGLWFNGWWDLGDKKDWNLGRTYHIVHDKQDQVLITNNHHEELKDGEDYELFYKKFPTSKKSKVPRETFFSISGSWGYNLVANDFLSSDEIILSIIRAAANNSNFTLNIGPMPNGKIQPEVVNKLEKVGRWMEDYGETIKGSVACVLPADEQLAFTQKDNHIYLFILTDLKDEIILPDMSIYEIESITDFKTNLTADYKTENGRIVISNGKGILQKGEVYDIKINRK